MVSMAEIEQYLWANPIWAITLTLFIFNGISILIWKGVGCVLSWISPFKKKITQRDTASYPNSEAPLFNEPEKNLTSTQDCPVENSKTTPQEKLPNKVSVQEAPEVYSPLPKVPVETDKEGYLDLTKPKEGKK